MHVMGAALIASNKSYGPWFAFLRGGMVINMAITGLVYALLLQHANDAHAALQYSWQNFLAHQFAPLFVVVEWLVWAPKYQISLKQSLLWLIYPYIVVGIHVYSRQASAAGIHTHSWTQRSSMVGVV